MHSGTKSESYGIIFKLFSIFLYFKRKIIYQRNICSCPNCHTGDDLNCLYTGFLGQWNVEELEIRYKTVDPAAHLRRDPTDKIMPELQQFNALLKGFLWSYLLTLVKDYTTITKRRLIANIDTWKFDNNSCNTTVHVQWRSYRLFWTYANIRFKIMNLCKY